MILLRLMPEVDGGSVVLVLSYSPVCQSLLQSEYVAFSVKIFGLQFEQFRFNCSDCFFTGPDSLLPVFCAEECRGGDLLAALVPK